MKKLASVFFLCLLLTSQAFAWGQNGHRAVGLVAEQHLSKKAKKKILKLLEENTLAEVSVWMDDIKSDHAYDHTHDWHWVTIPDGKSYEETEKNPHGDVIGKIEEVSKALKAGNLTKEQEQEYVKFLVHLVGDIHQPMHVGGYDDQGGNAVKVQWFYQPSNLHRVWDSDMIDSKNLSFTEVVRFLGEPNKEQVKQWQSASVRDWAKESMSYREQMYDLPEDKKLSYRYAYENYDLVEQRLLQAGIRLAGLLNEIYG
ncbi:S1/P1 nuclease [Pontibacter actiniarum]|uniref:S1/P1 Nuclease n=1 Tax=Pontibacter actiniarum TaxID=323450 RepID=A0A1X9YRK2_9BACT|nr:S1/P1 nuclease [Pontibacter actiniarum]ARS35492.1 S1/P1 Nuclease [Pontibacter actiniarum]